MSLRIRFRLAARLSERGSDGAEDKGDDKQAGYEPRNSFEANPMCGPLPSHMASVCQLGKKRQIRDIPFETASQRRGKDGGGY